MHKLGLITMRLWACTNSMTGWMEGGRIREGTFLEEKGRKTRSVCLHYFDSLSSYACFARARAKIEARDEFIIWKCLFEHIFGFRFEWVVWILWDFNACWSCKSLEIEDFPLSSHLVRVFSLPTWVLSAKSVALWLSCLGVLPLPPPLFSLNVTVTTIAAGSLPHQPSLTTVLPLFSIDCNYPTFNFSCLSPLFLFAFVPKVPSKFLSPSNLIWYDWLYSSLVYCYFRWDCTREALLVPDGLGVHGSAKSLNWVVNFFLYPVATLPTRCISNSAIVSCQIPTPFPTGNRVSVPDLPACFSNARGLFGR